MGVLIITSYQIQTQVPTVGDSLILRAVVGVIEKRAEPSNGRNMNHQSTESLPSAAVDAFQQAIAGSFAPAIWETHTVLVAVSGGPDSVALIRAIKFLRDRSLQSTGEVVVGHVQHGLRGLESDQDHRFVESLASELGLRFLVTNLDANQLRENAPNGLEAAARAARYRSLQRMAHEIGARYLATGHTMDDQIETVLFRICRGTGVSGLTGIPYQRQVDSSLSIVRPLLQLRRQDILAYLAALNQTACFDASNLDTAMSRNWIRNELLPKLRGRFSGVDTSLAQLASVASEYHQLAIAQAEPLLERAMVRYRPDQLVLRADVLAEQPRLLVQIAMQRLWQRQSWPQQEMSFDKWQLLVRMIVDERSGGSQRDFPGKIRANCHDAEIHLTREGSRKVP